MEELYNQLAALARRFGAKRLVLFGSRARGDNRPNSDIDLAVYGMPEDNRAEFWMCCEELPTLLKFDIVHITDGMEPVFLANIERDGVELMDKLHEKYDRFTAAVARLREALDDYKKFPLDSVRDGTIQRFEFCTELAWKTMREYLLDQGYTNINSPKEVITTSVPVIVYARELKASDEKLLRALTLSNLTTIHEKTPIGRLSAYCGAISAGAGAGAGIAYLCGGDYEAVIHTVVNALAVVSGVICDGAKASCAAKIATAVEAGLLGYNMYIRGNQFHGGDGIVAKGVENSLKNVGRLGKQGMKETNNEIIDIMVGC